MCKIKNFLIILVLFIDNVSIVFGSQSPKNEIVIYNNLAYILETRTIQLQSGSHSYEITNLPSQMNQGSIFIESLWSGLNISMKEFDANIFNFDEIMEKRLGKPVILRLTGNENVQGILAGFNTNEILLQEPDVITSVSRNQIKSISIEGITDVLLYKPVLRFFASSRRDGKAEIRLNYLTNAVGWSCEYVGIYDPVKKVLLLKSWARIRNYSGINIKADKMILIAGEPHQSREDNIIFPKGGGDSRMMAVETAPQFEREKAYIYHKYIFNQLINLNDKKEQQIQLFPEKEITANQKFVFDISKYRENIVTILEFTNIRSVGLGEPMPSGSINLYQRDDSDSIYLGGDRIENTPVEGRIAIQIGTAFDITGKRVQKEFQRYGDRGREETYEITLMNAGDVGREVVVVEHFGGQWKILESTHEFTKLDAYSAQFLISVPSKGKTVLTYRIRYEY